MIEPKSLGEAMNSDHRLQWKQAINDETQSLKSNETWELCELPKDRKAIGSKWTFKAKTDVNGNVVRFKARLVALQDFYKNSAPTTIKFLLRLLNRQHSERY